MLTLSTTQYEAASDLAANKEKYPPEVVCADVGRVKVAAGFVSLSDAIPEKAADTKTHQTVSRGTEPVSYNHYKTILNLLHLLCALKSVKYKCEK